MAFTNVELDTQQVPTASKLKMTPMAPAYRREVATQGLLVIGILFALSWLPFLLPVPHPLARTIFATLPLAVAVLGALIVLLLVRQAAHKGYALREHDIAYQSGLVFQKTVLLPFKRVQHVEVASGPLQRQFGLASLKFFTAGGASVDLKMDGLTVDSANDLREFILERGAHDRSG